MKVEDFGLYRVFEVDGTMVAMRKLMFDVVLDHIFVDHAPINAIRLVREASQVSLKDAKDFVMFVRDRGESAWRNV